MQPFRGVYYHGFHSFYGQAQAQHSMYMSKPLTWYAPTSKLRELYLLCPHSSGSFLPCVPTAQGVLLPVFSSLDEQLEVATLQ